MKKILFFLLGFMFLSFTGIAQEKDKKVTILVKDENNKPVPGAVILFDNVRQKRWTNSKGVFKTKFKETPKVISAYSPKIGIQKVNYNGKGTVIIKIKGGRDHYVITNPKAKEINTIQYRDIYDYLRGQVPGVHISGYNTINIRGYNSVNGSTTPLFVLNNTAVDQTVFDNIVPTTIKSLKVLKGPETSTYGSRGANGVIIVETY